PRYSLATAKIIMSHIEATLARILEIDLRREPVYERRWSHYALYREYMRRFTVWGQEFHWSPSYNDLLYRDLADSIQSSISLPRDIVSRYEANTSFRLNLKAKRFFLHALKWAVLEDSDETNRFSLLNPYELIILIYERGGFVSGEHGFIEITGMSFFVG